MLRTGSRGSDVTRMNNWYPSMTNCLLTYYIYSYTYKHTHTAPIKAAECTKWFVIMVDCIHVAFEWVQQG